MATTSFNFPSPLAYRNIVRNHYSSKKKIIANKYNNENIYPCMMILSHDSTNSLNKNDVDILFSPSSLIQNH